MTKHDYNSEALTRYLLGTLPEDQTEVFDELSIVDDEFAESLDAVEKDLVDAYVEEDLSGPELKQFERHYLATMRGAQNVKFARAFRVLSQKEALQLPPVVAAKRSAEKERSILASAVDIFARRRRVIQWGFAATVLVLLTVGGWLAFENARLRQQVSQAGREQARTNDQSQVPESTPGPSASITPLPKEAKVIAQLNDGGRQVTIDEEGKLSGFDWVPSMYQPLLKEALTTQKLNKSPLLAGITRPGSALMSTGAQGNNFSVIEPTGKVLLSDRPTFRWTQLPGATGYVVEVYDEKFKLVASSPSSTSDSWTVPTPLRRGGIYSWQVKALKDGVELNSPKPPAPQAKFRILDQAKANELDRARSAYASSHFLMALLYARVGLLDEAEDELKRLQKDNPGSATVSRLLASVQAARK